jgi:hypothetical protein
MTAEREEIMAALESWVDTGRCSGMSAKAIRDWINRAEAAAYKRGIDDAWKCVAPEKMPEIQLKRAVKAALQRAAEKIKEMSAEGEISGGQFQGGFYLLESEVIQAIEKLIDER